MRTSIASAACLFVVACSPSSPPAVETAPVETAATSSCPHGGACGGDAPAVAPPSTQSTQTPTAPQTFGAAIDASLPLTPLAAIIGAPDDHAQQVVRTRGVVHRVCQRMGCWMELRDGDGPAVRVPMSGHAFFLPRDCQGRPAEVQGRVTVQTLSPEARAHLGSEGATVLASTIAIDATGVVLGVP